MNYEKLGMNHSLEKVMKLSEATKIKTLALPQMMRHNIVALTQQYEMHLTNRYNFRFPEVASAFLKKYQNENSMFTTTTIAHISSIDENKF
jgi:hypothetical protein